MNVVVINPHASRMRASPSRVGKITAFCEKHKLHVICEDTKVLMVAELRHVLSERKVTTVFVIGGDGTFNDVLN